MFGFGSTTHRNIQHGRWNQPTHSRLVCFSLLVARVGMYGASNRKDQENKSPIFFAGIANNYRPWYKILGHRAHVTLCNNNSCQWIQFQHSNGLMRPCSCSPAGLPKRNVQHPPQKKKKKPKKLDERMSLLAPHITLCLSGRNVAYPSFWAFYLHANRPLALKWALSTCRYRRSLLMPGIKIVVSRVQVD